MIFIAGALHLFNGKSLTLAGVAALLAIAACIACYIPACELPKSRHQLLCVIK